MKPSFYINLILGMKSQRDYELVCDLIRKEVTGKLGVVLSQLAFLVYESEVKKHEKA